MKTNTQEKIDEAYFFLQKCNENYSNFDFKFYYSAFVSSSRSVLWVMKSEFSNVKHYKEWHSKRIVSNDEKVIFERINDLRVRTTKISPIKTKRIFSSIISVEGDFDKAQLLGKDFIVNISEPDDKGNQKLTFDTQNGEQLEGIVQDHKIVDNVFSDEDLFSIGEKYLNIISEIYDEWIQYYSEKEQQT